MQTLHALRRRGLLAAGGAASLAAWLPAQAQTQAMAQPLGITTRGWTSTQGGRGGRILKVTTLAASGPGSLKAALEASGPRIVVFEVGGVIDMGGKPLKISEPFVTVAGQTAPDPGITVIKAETTISTHDVVIQHLSFRPGEFGRPKKGGDDQDGISTVGGAHDVIVDHCSFSWATDENLSASGPRFEGKTVEQWREATSHRITYSHNLIYEGLSNSVHVKGEHSKGSLIHDNTSGVLIHANVYVSNRQRNALFKGGAQGAMVNNYIFNPGDRAVHYNLLANEWEGQPHQTGKLTLVGNALRHGPSTVAGRPSSCCSARATWSSIWPTTSLTTCKAVPRRCSAAARRQPPSSSSRPSPTCPGTCRRCARPARWRAICRPSLAPGPGLATRWTPGCWPTWCAAWAASSTPRSRMRWATRATRLRNGPFRPRPGTWTT